MAGETGHIKKEKGEQTYSYPENEGEVHVIRLIKSRDILAIPNIELTWATRGHMERARRYGRHGVRRKGRAGVSHAGRYYTAHRVEEEMIHSQQAVTE